MSKTMRIYGNFEQFGEWSEPDPGFEGYIIVEEDGSFVGYQNELYGVVVGMEDIHNELNSTRYVTGYIANNNKDGAEGIAYLKLSREDRQTPLMYVVPNLAMNGNWAAPGWSGFFEPKGKAKVSLEEVPADDAIVQRVNELRDLILNDDNPMNTNLLDQAYICLDILQNVE